ncbi:MULTISPECIES: TetR/AcrR family transcriptional regulator [Kitasatospora]|uniref:TetR/AcrR family transcriptional regulator n=1 Tax=Kitasatospora cystarginea TaxID=58350 RepID=A0ABN3F0T5_9ACTN
MSDSQRLSTGSDARRLRAERILDAATELLQMHGYRRVSVDDVARRAGVGKGTIYLHWKTREALFWAVLQRESMRLFDRLIAVLSQEPDSALPHRLMRAIFLGVVDRPLVQALLLSDAEVLGNLAKDETVAGAQRELAGNPNYLELLRGQGLLHPDLDTEAAGHVLGSIMGGFLTSEVRGEHAGLSLEERADLLSGVLQRALEAEGPKPPGAVAALNAQVVAMFTAITDTQRAQLQRAYQ